MGRLLKEVMPELSLLNERGISQSDTMFKAEETACKSTRNHTLMEP